MLLEVSIWVGTAPSRFIVPIRFNEQVILWGNPILGSAIVCKAASHNETIIEKAVPLGTTLGYSLKIMLNGLGPTSMEAIS